MSVLKPKNTRGVVRSVDGVISHAQAREIAQELDGLGLGTDLLSVFANAEETDADEDLDFEDIVEDSDLEDEDEFEDDEDLEEDFDESLEDADTDDDDEALGSVLVLGNKYTREELQQLACLAKSCIRDRVDVEASRKLLKDVNLKLEEYDG